LTTSTPTSTTSTPISITPTSPPSTTATSSAAAITPPTTSAPSLPVSATPCDYYASPSGSGTGRTSSSPFRIQNFWSVATPGATLCLHDGVYQGSASVITPPSGLSGTDGHPITVRALNEGKVLIDGQFARYPVLLSADNNWWVLEGFNARNSSCDVVRITGNSRHNVVRRVVGWDTPIGYRCAIFRTLSTSGPNLFEDVAGFGTVSAVFRCNQHGHGMTVRRGWARFEGTINGNNANGAFSAHYTCNTATWENVLATVDLISQPLSATIHNDNQPDPSLGTISDRKVPTFAGIFFANKNLQTSMPCRKVETYGSLGYVTASALVANLATGYANTNRSVDDPEAIECFRIWHTAQVMSPSNSRFPSFRPFGLGTASGVDTITRHTSGVGGLASSFSNWDAQNHVQGTSVSRVPNFWTNSLSGAGANLCHRYVNRVRTTEPLWPWPMNDRIKAATEMAGSYGGPCQTCVGGRQARKATDVTADIETLLGPIPAQCRAD
jgi:hypothetical protein